MRYYPGTRSPRGFLARQQAAASRTLTVRNTQSWPDLTQICRTASAGITHAAAVEVRGMYYASAYAQYPLEFFFRSRLLDHRYKPTRYHLLMALRHAEMNSTLP